jgi:hypothetical protein
MFICLEFNKEQLKDIDNALFDYIGLHDPKFVKFDEMIMRMRDHAIDNPESAKHDLVRFRDLKRLIDIQVFIRVQGARHLTFTATQVRDLSCAMQQLIALHDPDTPFLKGVMRKRARAMTIDQTKKLTRLRDLALMIELAKGVS